MNSYTNTLQIARHVAYFNTVLQEELDNRFPNLQETETLRKIIIAFRQKSIRIANMNITKLTTIIHDKLNNLGLHVAKIHWQGLEKQTLELVDDMGEGFVIHITKLDKED